MTQQRMRNRCTAGFAALVLAVAGSACVPEVVSDPPAPIRRPIVLDVGHIDLFDVVWDDATGQLDLQLKDDTQRYAATTVFRDPAEVTVDVDAVVAGLLLPDGRPAEYGFLGPSGRQVYLLDEVALGGLPWPGWSTERLAASLPPGVDVDPTDGSVVLEVDVTGPGDVFTWQTGGDGLPTARYIDTSDSLPDVIQTRVDIHAHTSWAFTEPGDYHFDVVPRLRTITGDTLTGPSHGYHVHVGEPLVVDPPSPTLDVVGGGAHPLGSAVTLTVSSVPDLGWPVRWYRWDGDSSHVVGSGSSLEVAVTAEWGIYLAVAIAPSGREVPGPAVEVFAG